MQKMLINESILSYEEYAQFIEGAKELIFAYDDAQEDLNNMDPEDGDTSVIMNFVTVREDMLRYLVLGMKYAKEIK